MRFPKGKTIDTRDLDSLAPAFKRGESRCGVYRLNFENGEAYCGQATNVIRRYAAHRRRHPDIVSVDFFPFSKARLNEAEQILIRETENEKPLRNIMLTGRPRGNDPVEITTAAGSTVALPWEPERAKGATKSLTDAGEQKLAGLLTHPDFHSIRSILGWYIALTIPDPVATAGQLWTVTCLPSTNKTDTSRRLLTLSCGNLETLYVFEHSVFGAGPEERFVSVRINTAILEGIRCFDSPDRFPDSGAVRRRNSSLRPRWDVTRVSYRNEQVTCFSFDLSALEEIVNAVITFPDLDDLVDAAYELNVRLMRRGSTMYSRFHHQRLAELLIAEAVVWETMLEDEADD